MKMVWKKKTQIQKEKAEKVNQLLKEAIDSLMNEKEKAKFKQMKEQIAAENFCECGTFPVEYCPSCGSFYYQDSEGSYTEISFSKDKTSF